MKAISASFVGDYNSIIQVLNDSGHLRVPASVELLEQCHFEFTMTYLAVQVPVEYIKDDYLSDLDRAFYVHYIRINFNK